jgi:hypothetical protein
MKHAMQAFVQVVKEQKPCDSFFYFSGHGMEQDGRSYLIPIDYSSPNTGKDLLKEKDNDTAVDLEERLLSKLNGAGCPDTMNVIVLDCCREDEENTIYRTAFGSSCTGSYGGNHECYRSAVVGHCAPDSSQFIVAFGTAPGTETIELQQENFGVFTGKFLDVLMESKGGSEEFHEIFRQVTVKVSDESQGRLEPWYNAGGLKRQFYFHPIHCVHSLYADEQHVALRVEPKEAITGNSSDNVGNGDMVTELRQQGAFVQVRCIDGRVGWIKKAHLSQVTPVSLEA